MRSIELGIDRFLFFGANAPSGVNSNPVPDLLEEIETADRAGIDVFGIGEHHTGEFADSSPAVLLSAAAARTARIRLSSAITILSVADPVRVFEDFATLDLVSNGRAEIVAGRGAYAEAFALFGLDLEQYDRLYAEKIDLMLKLQAGGPIHWRGRHRPALTGQTVHPSPVQATLPIWVGATGTPDSFVRAGALGLPLAVGIIGGDYDRLRPLVDVYREAGTRAGHSRDRLRVAIHAIGYVADNGPQARDEFFPAYDAVFGALARKLGRAPASRAAFDAMTSAKAALVVGDPSEVAAKLVYIDEVLGGVSRVCLQMTVGPLARTRRLRTIELLAGDVRSLLARDDGERAPGLGVANALPRT